MRVFDCEMTFDVIEAIARHGEREYPSEACGVVLGAPGVDELARVVPLRNVQDRYHERDPVRFPRTARDAFRVDDLERMRILEQAGAEGLVERILYHSHPDAGAYFSPEDRAAAVHEGLELMPATLHLVVSVRDGKRADMAAFRFDGARQRFDEVRVPLDQDEPPAALPDLELRTMEGGESARPIPPVGRGLVPRRVTLAERARIEQLVEARIEIDATSALHLDRLARGLLSPLTGFLRAAEVASIEATGRLLSGTDWRVPITLELPTHQLELEPGGVVELVDGHGKALAAFGVSDLSSPRKGRVRIGGPVYVYPVADDALLDAPEIRAALLRQGREKVLAIPARYASSGLPPGFDGYLVPEPRSAVELPYLLADGDGGWLDAAMAQNLGATHILTEDPSVVATIRSTLKIRPWHFGE